jgi:hypothetical protein
MPERDVRGRNIIPGRIISLIDRYRDRNPEGEELLNSAFEENIVPAIEGPLPDGFVESPDNSMALQEADEDLEVVEVTAEDRVITRKISAMYQEDFQVDGEGRSSELELADEFEYIINCDCVECNSRRERAMRVQEEREKEKARLATQNNFKNDKERDDLMSTLRSSMAGRRFEVLNSARSSEKLWEYLKRKDSGNLGYFTAIMSYMPDEVFERMVGLPSEDETDPIIKYFLASIGTISRMDNAELKFGKILERANGSARINRVAGTIGLTAYALAVERGFSDENNFLLSEGGEAELRERIESIQTEHKKRIKRNEPLNKLLKEPLRYGIEVECHKQLVPDDSIPDIEEVMGIAGWGLGWDGNGSYEYKSNPTEDVELLGIELRLMEDLGLLPFDTKSTMANGLRIAHGIHLTTGGLYFNLSSRYAEYKNINLLHHTDEATGYMTAFDYGQYDLKVQKGMIKGEILKRHEYQLGDNTRGGEQRTFIMYDREKFMQGLRFHARKTQALAAYQLLPDSVQEELDYGYEYPEDSENNVIFAKAIRQRRTWQEYTGRIEQVITDNIVMLDAHPLVKELAAEWVRYMAHTAALFKAVYLPDPMMPWRGETEYDNARPELYNCINSTFRTPEDYFKDPQELPWFKGRGGRRKQVGIIFGGKNHFVNFVHAIRSMDSRLSENVERAIEFAQGGSLTYSIDKQ